MGGGGPIGGGPYQRGPGPAGGGGGPYGGGRHPNFGAGAPPYMGRGGPREWHGNRTWIATHEQSAPSSHPIPSGGDGVGPSPSSHLTEADAEELSRINSVVNVNVTDFLPDRASVSYMQQRQPRPVWEHRPPPPNYVCFRCGQPGHWIQQCPTNGDQRFDIKKLKRPTGIPKTFLKQVDSSKASVMLPDGAGYAVIQPQETEFARALGHPALASHELPRSRTSSGAPSTNGGQPTQTASYNLPPVNLSNTNAVALNSYAPSATQQDQSRKRPRSPSLTSETRRVSPRD